MDLVLVQLVSFANQWKKFHLTDEDLKALEKQLRENPEAGVVLRGTGGLRKMRFAPPSRHTGKSGGFRVGYGYFRLEARVYLFTIFAKKDQENLSDAEVNLAKKTMEAIYRFHHREE